MTPNPMLQTDGITNRPNTYFIADTHFGDENIRRYENRPFQNVTEMNQALITNWNKTVNPDDIVYFLGDLGDESCLAQLHGTKFMVKGNHDTMPNDHYRRLGFAEVYDLPVIFNGFWILSHEPLYINRNMPYANIFGHIHNNPSYKTASSRSYCVSAERTSYTPIRFEAIKTAIQKLQQQEDADSQ